MAKTIRNIMLMSATLTVMGTAAAAGAQDYEYTPIYTHYYLDENGNDVGSYRDTCNRGYIGHTATVGTTTSEERTEIIATCDVQSGTLHPF